MRSVAISGTYALVRDYDGLTIFDVSDPSAPARVAHLTLPHVELIFGRVPAIKVRHGIAYLLATHGFDIVDVRDPTRPTRLGSYSYFPSGWPPLNPPPSAFDMEVAGDFIYVNGRYIVDVSNPISPTLQGGFNGGDHMTVVGDRAYGFNILVPGSYTLQIFDVHNPAAPAWRGDYSYSGPVDSWWNDLAVVGNTAYIPISNNRLGSELLILDVSDPLNITQRGKYATAMAPLGIVVVGNLAYLRTGDSQSQNGQIQIVDVSNPAKPALHGQYDAWAIDLKVAGTRAYAITAAPAANGLEVIDVSDPAHPTMLGRYNAPENPVALAVVGHLAYLGDSAGLDILDISDPAHPAWVGHYRSIGAPKQIVLDKGIAYFQVVPSTGAEIQFVDVHDPSHPVLQGRWASNGYFTVSDGLLYLSDAGLKIIDVHNPAKPTLLGHLTDISAGFGSARVVNGLLYTTSGDALQIFDVGNPAAPRRLARLSGGGGAGLEIKDGLAYMVRFGSTLVNPPTPDQLRLIDVHDPHNPTILTSIDISSPNAAILYNPSTVRTILADGLIYIIVDNFLEVVDIHDLNHLVVHRLSIPSSLVKSPIQDAQVTGGLIYLVGGNSGLTIFQLVDITTARVPSGGGTFTAHGGEITYTFTSGTFSTTATVAITEGLARSLPSTGDLVVAGPVFEATATYSATGAVAEPTQPYALTVRYTEAQRGAAIVATLGLYYWDGATWVRAPGSTLDPAARTITAAPSHFSRWAVLGETQRAYLPIVQRANL